MSIDTVAPSGIAGVQARIAAIQSRFGALAPSGASIPVVNSGYTTSTNGSAVTRSSFATALADTVSSTGSSAASSTAGTGGAEAAAGSSTGHSGADAVELSKKYLGIPYVWGGTDPSKGLDCSGLTGLVYRQLGVDLPRVSRDQAKVGEKIASLSQAKPGDLLFFNSPVSHVGIYAGGGKMVHAPRTGTKVRVEDVYETPTVIRRVLPENASAAPAPPAQAQPAARTGGVPYADIFRTEGARAGVSPTLLAAVAKTESSFRSDATSPAGARGLMQLMPATAAGLGVDPLDPQQAVRGAAKLLAGYLEDYDGSLDLALAAYNAGPGNVKKYGGVPPFSETKAYVRKVQDAMQEVTL
ncbi:NlpC/P60 family protein [Motilibacter aurantiacus]|uniref:NlpC/P60 family protein n=1 Tax=Motilibacter aurantiacus TaxID=2714955 RepID=UPI001409CACB|nr:NlpC/P60 family protein [Motilibacter aurantiacus]NHC47100.1 transglycosylase SLT domain-containing protein [Motilibacter aurantiacus]